MEWKEKTEKSVVAGFRLPLVVAAFGRFAEAARRADLLLRVVGLLSAATTLGVGRLVLLSLARGSCTSHGVIETTLSPRIMVVSSTGVSSSTPPSTGIVTSSRTRFMC